jgi:hypothetical protein
MKKTATKLSFKILIEILLGLVIILFIGLGIFAGFLAQGPLNLQKFIPAVENHIMKNAEGADVSINELYMTWQGYDDPLGIQAKSVLLKNEDKPFLFAPEIDLNISLRSLLLGKMHFEDIRIRNLSLSITRTQEGQIQLTGQQPSEPSAEEENAYDSIPQIVTLNDIVSNLPSFDNFWLDAMRIIYRDNVADTIQRFDPVTFFMVMNDDQGRPTINGHISLPFDNTADEIAKLNFITRSDPLSLVIDTTLKDVAIDHILQFLPKLPSGGDVNMVVDGHARLEVDNLWRMRKLDVDLAGARGQIIYNNGKDESLIETSDFNLSLSTNPVTQTLNIDDASFVMNETAQINLEGSLRNINNPETVSGNLKISASDVQQSWFDRYWPDTENAKDNGAYRWLTQKINGGQFNQISLSTTFDLAKKAREDNLPLPPQLHSVEGEFTYSDLTIDYRAPLAKATQVKGTGTYKDVALSLAIDTADIGGLSVKNATLDFDDLITSGAGTAKLRFPITGNAQNVFDYIAAEPISAFDNVDFNPKDAQGDADLIASLEFPLAKDTPLEAFDINVTGTVNNLNLDNAVRDLTLAGGPFDLRASINDINVKGSGTLSGQPITLDWHEYFSTESASGKEYLSKIDATLTANQRIRRTFLNDFSQYFSGETGVTLAYKKDITGQDTHIDVDLDLARTKLQARSLGLLKPVGQASTASLDVKLRNGYLRQIDNLSVNGHGASLKNGQIDFMTSGGEPLISKGKLSGLAFDENKIDLELQGTSDILKINVTGQFLDARPILEGEKDDIAKNTESAGRPLEIGVNVIEMRTADTATLTDVEIYTRSGANGQAERFEMNAKAGRGDLYVRYTPDEAGRLSLQIESNNAGDTLRAFDLYPNVQDGTLRIAGIPIEGGRFGDVQGKVRIDNFRVSDGPILIRLLNALAFRDSGKLNFTRLESNFEWRIGDQGDIYRISNGTTAGASIGLTFDGYVDTALDEINIKGTAAPLEGINNLVGNIPLIGDILTGGGGALVAATYTVQGTTKDPKISVNPLSVLTPGIIRKMLFENATPEPDEQKAAPVKRDPRGLN